MLDKVGRIEEISLYLSTVFVSLFINRNNLGKFEGVRNIPVEKAKLQIKIIVMHQIHFSIPTAQSYFKLLINTSISSSSVGSRTKVLEEVVPLE